jgi:hypothetical protein
VTLLLSAAVFAAAGAIIAALTGGKTWHTIMWTLIVGGGILVIINVVGSGASRPAVDPRSGFSAGSVNVRDAATSPSWLFVGLVLVGLGALGLVLG